MIMLFGLGICLVWALGAAKTLKDILLALVPIVAFLAIPMLLQSMLPNNWGIGSAFAVQLLVIGVLKIGGYSRDRAMRAVRESET